MQKPERVPEVLAQAKTWVGEKICIRDGNAIELQWLSTFVRRAKKNNEFKEVREGGI
jgi:hypothetical protein